MAIEAVGDDFAQVGGQWLEGAAIAGLLSQAKTVWAFFSLDSKGADAVLSAIDAQDGTWLAAVVPGRQDGWDVAGRESVAKMLGMPVTAVGLYGLVVAVDTPTCNCPKRADRNKNCGQCSHGCGTKCSAEALYTCNGKQPD